MSKRVPKRRFKGFKNEWDDAILCEISDVRDGTHDSPQYYPSGHPLVTSKNVKDGYINYDEIQYISDDDYKEINKRSKVDVNDILMGMIGTIGNLALIRNEPDFAIKNVALIKYTGSIDSSYLYYQLQSNNINKQILQGLDGGTQKFIALNKIRELNVLKPNKEEQNILGDFFYKIDEYIILNQQKYDKLQALKKAYLYEMFPQEGESVPKRRFAEFSGEWKCIKFNDIVKRLSQIDNTKQLFGVEYEDIVSGRGRLCDNFHKKKILKSGIRFSKGDILYGKLRPYLMNFILADFDGVAIGDFWVLRPNENVCSELIYTLIQTDMFCEIANQSVGTKMPRADWSVVSNTYFYIPISLKEQKRIGIFFMNIDSQINRVDNKINKLKTLKQAYLAEMFV